MQQGSDCSVTIKRSRSFTFRILMCCPSFVFNKLKNTVHVTVVKFHIFGNTIHSNWLLFTIQTGVARTSNHANTPQSVAGCWLDSLCRAPESWRLHSLRCVSPLFRLFPKICSQDVSFAGVSLSVRSVFGAFFKGVSGFAWKGNQAVRLLIE